MLHLSSLLLQTQLSEAKSNAMAGNTLNGFREEVCIECEFVKGEADVVFAPRECMLVGVRRCFRLE